MKAIQVLGQIWQRGRSMKKIFHCSLVGCLSGKVDFVDISTTLDRQNVT